MPSVKDINLYKTVVKELEYPFGTVFIFEKFIVSEINQGINFNWEEHGKHIVSDISEFLNTNGEDIIYISNRIHSYSVVASDWLKFFKYSYSLKCYIIVSNEQRGTINVVIERLFFNKKIKRFNDLHTAINWIENRLDEIS